MSSNAYSDLLETLRNLDCEAEACHDILSRTFDTCLKLHEIIDNNDSPSNTEDFQNALKTCIKYLEKCTHMVNQLDLFSSNESFEEIQTSSIRYLLLPALLGNLNLMLQSKELSQRLEFLQVSEVYFKDFLFRCKNYELSKRKIINAYEKELFEESESNEHVPNKQLIIGPNIQNHSDLVALRESRILQYRLKKELKDRENELKPALEREDEENIREYYLVILERWMLIAIEELSSLKTEKTVLGCMIESRGSSKSVSSKSREIKPLKPIIITKNEIQKKVFGLGYPSIPVLTIEDFYRQRFEKMVKEHQNNSVKSLQDMAEGGGNRNNEEEEIEKELLLDKDDVDALKKARAWDEWKDDNPRGSGNRKNKG